MKPKLNTQSKFETYEDTEKIDINIVDDKGKPVKTLTKTIRTNIFQPNHVKESWSRKYLKMLLKMTESRERAYVKIHRWLKPYFIYPLLKLVKLVMKKEMIHSDDDIVKEWYNNNIRVFRHCFHESVDDIWRIMLYHGSKEHQSRFATGQEYYEYFRDAVKDKPLHPMFARKFLCDFWITEMLYDTVDREWCNFFVARVAREICMVYGVDPKEVAKIPQPGQFPVYMSETAHNPNYFRYGAMNPVWLHPSERSKDRDKKEKEMLNKSVKPEILGNIIPDKDNHKIIGGKNNGKTDKR